ncbi:MAG: hypothetical protein K9J27_09855 [Bacteroidales bacterium]|nr:hypothetical protein [Bacteroidales bacterium]MCF8334158.1 hypothetical protein [Bacteroidales bacterium]
MPTIQPYIHTTIQSYIHLPRPSIFPAPQSHTKKLEGQPPLSPQRHTTNYYELL